MPDLPKVDVPDPGPAREGRTMSEVCPTCYGPKERASWAFCYRCRVKRRNEAIRKTWRKGGRMYAKKYATKETPNIGQHVACFVLPAALLATREGR